MRLLLAVALLTAACGESSHDDCEQTASRNVTLDADQSDASMALAIHDCKVDVDACTALCARVADGTPTRCDVHFTDAHVYIDVSWQESNPDATDCAVPAVSIDGGFIPVDAEPILD